MNQRSVTKTVKKYGNSGGVYLPSSWIGGEAEVRLIRKPTDPERDIPLAFSGMMKHIVSIFIYGSYARGEYAKASDIDVIIVTDMHAGAMKTPEKLKAMNYDIMIMNREEINEAAEKDALFRKSLEEARAILNEGFLDGLKSLKIKRETLRERMEFAESSLGIIKGIFGEGGENSNLIYPLVMRIKEMLLVKCILQNRKYSLKLLKDSIKGKGISEQDFLNLMEHYRAVRDDKKPKRHEFREEVFRRLIELLEEMVASAKKKEKDEKGN